MLNESRVLTVSSAFLTKMHAFLQLIQKRREKLMRMQQRKLTPISLESVTEDEETEENILEFERRESRQMEIEVRRGGRKGKEGRKEGRKEGKG